MTEQFMQNVTETDLIDNDNVNEDQEEKETDTKSVEYQLEMVQKRLSDKDEYIKTLEKENQKTREMYSGIQEKLSNLDKIDEVVSRINQDVNSQDTSLDEDALVGKVLDNLSRKQAEEKMQQNYNNVINTLTETFGKDYVEEKVQKAAQENGLSVQDMVETAKKSPQAFYRLVGVQASKPSQPNPTHGTVSHTPTSGNKDFAYYSRLMKTNPKEYWKPETQREYRKLFEDK